MASKEHTAAVSAPSRTSSLRSAKRNSSDAEIQLLKIDTIQSVPSATQGNAAEKRAEKRAVLSCKGQHNNDHGIGRNTGQHSAETGNLTKKKRKPFKGFVKKKRPIKKSKLDVKHSACDMLVDVKCNTSPVINDQIDSNCYEEDGEVHKLLEERPTTSIPTYESPRKARINAPKLQACTNCTSPKKASRHRYFDPSDVSHVQAVKAALHLSTVPDTLICRDAEQSKVFSFCKDCIQQQQPGSLYICGCPGTGKSLLMEKVKLLASKWAEEGQVVAPDVCSFNCTSLTNSSDIFDQIVQHISLHEGKKERKDFKGSGLAMLKSLLRKPETGSVNKMLLLIIDEIDYLISKDRAILHELFELPVQKKSRCILIGISNSIDLADKCLQNMNSLNCRPAVVPFSPYTKDQLIAVLKQRIQKLPFTVFQQAALELCARKVAAASGDMRKALHVCRIAVELLELEKIAGANEKSAENGSYFFIQEAPASPSKKLGSPGSSKQQDHHLVQIHHMAQALTKTFRSSAVDTVKSLPKHQQMVLCVAVLLFRQKRKDTTIGQLNVRYVDFCKATSMPALSVPEFSSVCRVLADQGLLNLGTSREERLKRVTLQVDEDDIVFALQAIRFFCNHLA